METGMGPDIFLGAFGLIFGILYLGIFGLSIYLMISTILFFKSKTKNDTELLRKMDELIQLQKPK